MGKIQFRSYFFDFLGAMLKLHNISMTVYMLLNACLSVALLFSLISSFFAASELTCIAVAVLLYLLSLALMLSPVGEWMLRRQIGATALTSLGDAQEQARLETLFAKVLVRAKRINPNLEDGICLLLKEDASLNAFAIGRKTIVIHTGTIGLPNNQVAAILAHEVGHISGKDTDLRLAMTVGNVFASCVFFLLRLLISAFHLLVNLFSSRDIIFTLIRLVFSAIAAVMTFVLLLIEKIWFFIGKIAMNVASQKQEYEADEFSVNCGCGKALSAFLTHLLLDCTPDAERDNILKSFMSTHPQIRMRLVALANLGVPIDRADLLLQQ